MRRAAVQQVRGVVRSLGMTVRCHIMKRSTQRIVGAALIAAASMMAGNSATAQAAHPRSEADVNFMSGMIPHHAQAVLIAGWAPTHGARTDVAILCERIVVGQRDEIGLMQYWLKEHGETVPDAKAT